VPNCFGYPLVFVDESEHLIMADDVAMLSNPPIAPVENEEFEEAPFDVNVFQQLCKEKPSKRVVRTQIDRSPWDRRLSHNPHVLAIHLKFVPARGAAP
jgi:hypothetical protein